MFIEQYYKRKYNICSFHIIQNLRVDEGEGVRVRGDKIQDENLLCMPSFLFILNMHTQRTVK